MECLNYGNYKFVFHLCTRVHTYTEDRRIHCIVIVISSKSVLVSNQLSMLLHFHLQETIANYNVFKKKEKAFDFTTK